MVRVVGVVYNSKGHRHGSDRGKNQHPGSDREHVGNLPVVALGNGVPVGPEVINEKEKVRGTDEIIDEVVVGHCASYSQLSHAIQNLYPKNNNACSQFNCCCPDGNLRLHSSVFLPPIGQL